MPEIKAGRDYPLCPEGTDIFRLKEVELKDMPNFERTGTNERLIWKFISRQQDPETGEFFEVSVITPPYYTGHPRSKLTWLMGRIDKRVNKDWIKSNRLNTDQYVDRDYEGTVEHTLSEDGSKTYAVFATLRPLTNAASAPGPSADEFDDPFELDDPGAVVACEVCQSELTDMEAIACAKRWGDGHRRCTTHARELIAEEKRAALEADDIFAVA